MVSRDKIVEGILTILEEINEEMGLDLGSISEDTEIIGDGSIFDSMAFLNFIGAMEEWIENEYGIYVGILSEDEQFTPDGIFGKVKRFADYLVELINHEMEIPLA